MAQQVLSSANELRQATGSIADRLLLNQQVMQVKWSRYIPHAPTSKQIAFLALPHREALYGGSAGGGKALSLEHTNVLTPYGFRPLKDIKVGNKVCTPDGGNSLVIGVYDQGLRPTYRIEFQDGSECFCDEEHLWVYSIARKGKWTKSKKDAKIATTSQLIKMMDEGKAILTPVTKPIQLTKTYRFDMRILNPWLVGALIGDGSMLEGNRVRFTTVDEEIINKVTATGYDWKQYKDKRNAVVSVESSSPELKNQLKRLKLYGKYAHQKRIPDSYLHGPIDARWELLRGLMDTDGYLSDDGKAYYTTTSKGLADDVQWLVSSLGGRASIANKIATCNGKEHRKAYTVYIVFPKNSDCVSLSRKKIRTKPKRIALKRRIVSIKYIGKKACRCIKIDHVDGLFLIDGFVVTHNTDALLMGALQYFDCPGYKALIIRRSVKEGKYAGAVFNRAKKWLEPFLATKEVRWVAAENTFYSCEGASLAFGYLDKVEDEEQYQGADFCYCVGKGTRILMEDSSYKAIESVKVGDVVQTLEGPKPVTKTFGPRRKFCVKVRNQIQGWDHQIFSGDSWLDYGTLLSKLCYSADNTSLHTQQISQSPSQIHGSRSSDSSRLCKSVDQLPLDSVALQDFFAWLKDDRSGYEGYCDSPLKVEQLPALYVQSRLFLPDLLSGRCNSDVSYDLQHSLTEDSLSCCFGGSHPCDEHAQSYPKYNDRYGLPSQADAAKSSLAYLPQDVLGSTPSHSHRQQHTHTHPYTKELRSGDYATASSLDRIEPFGFSDVYDIRVADASHFITESQFINKNCGLDELTHYYLPQYEYMFSRVRRGEDNMLSTAHIPLRVRGATNPGSRGHRWVKDRFQIEKDPVTGEFRGMNPMRPFIQAKLEDNPFLDQKAYDLNLGELGKLQRDRLRWGNWDASPDAVLKPEWFINRWSKPKTEYYHLSTTHGLKVVHQSNLFLFTTTDVAGSESTGIEGRVLKKSNDYEPAWSVYTLWGMTKDFDLLMLDMIRGQWTLPAFLSRIIQKTRDWKPVMALVEDNSIGLGIFQGMKAKGITVKAVRSEQDKVVRSTPFQLRAEMGKVFLPSTSSFLTVTEDEFFAWTGRKGEVCDIIDTASLAGDFVGRKALGSELEDGMSQGRHIARPMASGGLSGVSSSPIAHSPQYSSPSSSKPVLGHPRAPGRVVSRRPVGLRRPLGSSRGMFRPPSRTP